jgi:hypothetical protein
VSKNEMKGKFIPLNKERGKSVAQTITEYVNYNENVFIDFVLVI